MVISLIVISLVARCKLTSEMGYYILFYCVCSRPGQTLHVVINPVHYLFIYLFTDVLLTTVNCGKSFNFDLKFRREYLAIMITAGTLQALR